jgi:hypothetical protein
MASSTSYQHTHVHTFNGMPLHLPWPDGVCACARSCFLVHLSFALDVQRKKNCDSLGASVTRIVGMAQADVACVRVCGLVFIAGVRRLAIACHVA